MRVLCRIGFHSWKGCKCARCGKVRNASHDWRSDCEQCLQCGEIRIGAHDWQHCKCTICDQRRADQHDWSGDCERCIRCGETRKNVHNWQGCVCTGCRANRNGVLEGGEVIEELHDWSKDCEQCAACRRRRSNAHQWHGCTCVACAKLRDTNHAWRAGLCTVCGKQQNGAEAWVDEFVKKGNYRELAVFVGKYRHKLSDDDQQRRACAKRTLLAAGAEVVDVVSEVFVACEEDYQELAKILIASKDRRAAIPLLSHFYEMSRSSFGREVVGFFVETNAVEVREALVTLLQHRYWGTRYLAANALGRLEIADTADALLKALKGDPHVYSGLKDASTVFARSLLTSFDAERKATGPKVDTMSELDMLTIMKKFASAYLAEDNLTRDRLEVTVKDIGEELYRRGGEKTMRKMLQHFEGAANRHIERVWSGIGSWLG